MKNKNSKKEDFIGQVLVKIVGVEVGVKNQEVRSQERFFIDGNELETQRY
jgi:hypothetical protein